MRVIEPSYKIITEVDGEKILKRLEEAIRTCYKSEDLITEDSHKKIIKHIMTLSHFSTIEHESVSVRIICNRGALAEITRHRLASFSVESTRYCSFNKDKFSNQITLIKPNGFDEWTTDQKEIWFEAMKYSETCYMSLVNSGLKAQHARGVLPIDLKTEMVLTANLREWRHIFIMRTQNAAHPSMHQIFRPMLEEFQNLIPIIFDDIKW